MQRWSRILIQSRSRRLGSVRIASLALLAPWLLMAQVQAAPNGEAAPANRATETKRASNQPVDAAENHEAATRTIDDAIKLARERRAVLNDVHDYTATFAKMELVGKKVIRQTMEIKCRHEPFSVYLHNREGKEEGREVLYVTGANGGNLLVHERGLLASLAGTQSLKLDDSLVMDENRYPITEIGIAKIVDKSIAIWESEKKADPNNIQVRFFPNAKVGPVACEQIEVARKQQRPEFEFSLTRVFFARDTKLPVRAEQYGWPAKTGEKPPLVEEYDYSNLNVNVGLSEADFDPKNPMYGFEGSPTK
jgi:hypothetical protein